MSQGAGCGVLVRCGVVVLGLGGVKNMNRFLTIGLFLLIAPFSIAQESKSKLRNWEAINGNKVEAELVSVSDGQVSLKMKTGKIFKVPLNKLSKADQEFLKAKSSPANPVKEEAPVNPNLKYETEGAAVTITGCDEKASGALTIPAIIEGKTVTSIGRAAFRGCTRLTGITIPDGVTSIGGFAFFGCTSLTSITIPDGVTSIGEGALAGCSSLTTVTFLGDAPKVGKGVFSITTPTIYRKPEAKGWGETWGKRPVKLISEEP